MPDVYAKPPLGSLDGQAKQSFAARSEFLMDTLADENELIRKLVFTGHLNVPERRALTDRNVKARLIYSVLEESLHSGEWFHAWWLPDDSMIGCVIKYRGEGSRRVLWSYSGVAG